MNLALPDWVPWWVPLVLLLPAALYALAFLFMPFSVIGLKSRLEGIEARLDEIQQELRNLAVRDSIPPSAHDAYDAVYDPPPVARRMQEPAFGRPPIPPAPQTPRYDDADEDRPPPPPHMRPIRRGETQPAARQEPRTEPRVNWPR